jgi:hypothetical protein
MVQTANTICQVSRSPGAMVEIIGYETSNQTYPKHCFDSHGESGAMQAREHDSVWTFTVETMRSWSFRDNGNVFAGTREMSGYGLRWPPMMNIRLTKAQ